jgi:hypothetical protein
VGLPRVRTLPLGQYQGGSARLFWVQAADSGLNLLVSVVPVFRGQNFDFINISKIRIFDFSNYKFFNYFEKGVV